MSKATEQNEKLKRAITVSVILHIILIALLVWSSFDENIDASGGGGGSDIDAVMVDSDAVVEQYNRQQNQQSESKRAEKQRQKQAQQQAEELQKKHAAEQKQLKQMEKERLQLQEEAKQQAAQQAAEQKQAEAAAAKAKVDAKAQADAQAKSAADAQKKTAEEAKKAAADAKKQAEAEAKQAAAEAAKEKAVADAEAKADADAKAAAEAKKKAAAEAAKESGDIGDLLGDLTSGKNAPKSGKAAGGGRTAGPGNQKSAGASGAEINGYLGQITAAIQSKFYDASTYAGKTCNLRIKLAPDGMLISVQSEGGDPALCQAAIAAAKQARIPKPPTQAVYEVFKNAPMRFKP